MAIQNFPTGNREYFDLIRYFRPSGSQTVSFAQDMGTGQLLRILRWGNELYVPVYEGMQLGVGVYNGNRQMRAYPMYVEARNLWEGGDHRPEQCSTDHMWELRPGQTELFDKLMNPNRPAGRPLIIQQSGQGMTIGEASFGTTEFKGQVRLYERLPYGGGHQVNRPTNQGTGMVLQSYSQPVSRGETYGLESVSRGGTQKGLTQLSGGAGIGAGAEVYQNHHDTGISYSKNAQPVVFLRMEYREDLEALMRAAWGPLPWSWYEDFPGQSNWWDLPWDWRQRQPTMPEIPVARSHQPRRS